MNIVIDSTFNPFSYQEMLAPVLAETQAHQAIEDYYQQLSEKASVWEKLANNPLDQEAYNTYQTYIDQLKNAANDLNARGLTRGSNKRDLFNLRSQYIQLIKPIEDADKKRTELILNQYNTLLNNPWVKYERDASEIPLQELINNPNYMPRGVNGQDIYNKAKEQAAAASSRIDPEFKNVISSGVMKYMKQGFNEQNAQDLYNYLRENDTSPDKQNFVQAYSWLKDIFESYPSVYGYKGWKDENSLNDMAYQGLMAGLVANNGNPFKNIDMLDAKERSDAAATARAQAETERSRRALEAYQKASLAESKRQFNETMKYQRQALNASNAGNPDASYGIGDTNTIALTGNNPEAGKQMLNFITEIGGSYDANTDTFKIGNTVSLDKGVTEVLQIGYSPSAGVPLTSRVTRTPVNKNGSNNFQLFNGNGQLMEKTMFVTQGKTQQDKNILSSYYDRVEKRLIDIGVANSKSPILSSVTGKRITKGDISNGMASYAASLGGSYLNVMGIPVGNSKTPFTLHIAPYMGEGLYLVNGGNIRNLQSSKRVSREELNSRNKDYEYAYNLILNQDNPGLLITDTLADYQYFQPVSMMSSSGKNAVRALIGNRYEPTVLKRVAKEALDKRAITPAQYNDAVSKIEKGQTLRNSAALAAYIKSMFGVYDNFNTSVNM